MRIIVSCTEEQKKELTVNDVSPGTELVFIHDNPQLAAGDADAYLDLQFENTTSRIDQLKRSAARVIIINSVVSPLMEIDASFIRINAWPTFIASAFWEGSYKDAERAKLAEDVLAAFYKKIEWLPDEPGFITARVICMIINEAYFALSEQVSTKEEIDSAMKLGTNYPFGPFEWAKKIGLKNIVQLLDKLSEQQSRYLPCPLMLEEVEHAEIQRLTG